MRAVEKTPLGIWAGALSNEVCDRIIAEGALLSAEAATICHGRGIDEAIRDSKVGWFPSGSWIDNLLLSYVFRTNRLNEWNFNLDNAEKVQFTRYEKDDFYIWHRDSNIDSETQRKISITVQLSDYSSYEGGEFQIQDCWGQGEAVIPEEGKQRGSIIIFPSFLLHQVTPVTSGVRYSLVQWYSGPPFT